MSEKALRELLTEAVPDLHPRTAELVQRFAVALAEKLAAAEKKYGYSDKWAEPDWMDECRAKLIEHVDKGDPRDVAAYCAFLWHHGERTALAQPAAPVPLTDEWVACIKRPVVVHVRAQRNGEVDVSTREGITPVAPDDLIMRGVDGEVYPICRSVFERTYDLLSDKQATPAQPAAPAEGDSLLGRAFSDCAAAEVLKDE